MKHVTTTFRAPVLALLVLAAAVAGVAEAGEEMADGASPAAKIFERLKALDGTWEGTAGAPEGTLRFDFVGGSNLDPATDGHIHEGSVTLVDEDSLEETWVGYAQGEPAHTMKFDLERVE